MWEWISDFHIEKIVGYKEYRNKGDENVELRRGGGGENDLVADMGENELLFAPNIKLKVIHNFGKYIECIVEIKKAKFVKGSKNVLLVKVVFHASLKEEI